MKRKIVYSGRVIEVVKERRLLPNNSYIDLELIEHRGAALIVPFLTNDKIIMIKQFRPAINSYIYELPAGTMEKGESPVACAKREIKEEIGYQAGRLTRIGNIFPVPGYSTEKINIFRADGLKPLKVAVQRDKDEIIYPSAFTIKQIRDFFAKGKIVDAKTICAFAMCSVF